MKNGPHAPLTSCGRCPPRGRFSSWGGPAMKKPAEGRFFHVTAGNRGCLRSTPVTVAVAVAVAVTVVTVVAARRAIVSGRRGVVHRGRTVVDRRRRGVVNRGGRTVVNGRRRCVIHRGSSDANGHAGSADADRPAHVAASIGRGGSEQGARCDSAGGSPFEEGGSGEAHGVDLLVEGDACVHVRIERIKCHPGSHCTVKNVSKRNSTEPPPRMKR